MLTVELAVAAFAFGAVAIVAVLRWLWATDLPPPRPRIEAAQGVQLPVGSSRLADSHSWWASLILVAVDMTVFASFVYAHVHVAMAADTCPPPGAALPALRWPWASAALLAMGSLLMATAPRRLRDADPRAQRVLRLQVALAMLCVAGAFGIDLLAQAQAGLNPQAQAWSATVAMLLAYQGLHVVVLMMMGAYLLARSFSGRLQPQARATLDNTLPLWHCATLQGIGGLLLVQGLPRLLG
ncbi:putative cytochrome c oxidase chain I protein [Variovorax sp. WDL1]|nr:putative cytochrome c oxidase chain I protein [Variovorax sp. WDL1]